MQCKSLLVISYYVQYSRRLWPLPGGSSRLTRRNLMFGRARPPVQTSHAHTSPAPRREHPLAPSSTTLGGACVVLCTVRSYINTHVHINIHNYVHTRTHTYTKFSTHKETQLIHVQTNAHAKVRSSTHIHTHTRTHTHARTHIHTHTHTKNTEHRKLYSLIVWNIRGDRCFSLQNEWLCLSTTF